MRVHKARGAAYDLDKERNWNWFRPGKGERRPGAVRTLNQQELREFCEREGLVLSDNATLRPVKHV